MSQHGITYNNMLSSINLIYMLQPIFGISQSLGLTEPTSQFIRLPDTTSQYLGLPKNISHSLGLPKKYFYFSHILTEMNVSVITASLYLISHTNPSRNQLNFCKQSCLILMELTAPLRSAVQFSPMLLQYVSLVKNSMFVCGGQTKLKIISSHVEKSAHSYANILYCVSDTVG